MSNVYLVTVGTDLTFLNRIASLCYNVSKQTKGKLGISKMQGGQVVTKNLSGTVLKEFALSGFPKTWSTAPVVVTVKGNHGKLVVQYHFKKDVAGASQHIKELPNNRVYTMVGGFGDLQGYAKKVAEALGKMPNADVYAYDGKH